MPRRTWPLSSFTTVTTIRSPITILSPSLRDKTSMEDSFPGGFAPGEYGSPSRGIGDDPNQTNAQNANTWIS